MVHHIVLFKLKPDMSDEQIEDLMMNTRRLLLKIPEARNVKCGKRINDQMHWEFFLAADFESMEKLRVYRDDPVHFKYVEDFLKPSIVDRIVLDYETDPARNTKYS